MKNAPWMPLPVCHPGMVRIFLRCDFQALVRSFPLAFLHDGVNIVPCVGEVKFKNSISPQIHCNSICEMFGIPRGVFLFGMAATVSCLCCFHSPAAFAMAAFCRRIRFSRPVDARLRIFRDRRHLEVLLFPGIYDRQGNDRIERVSERQRRTWRSLLR